MWRYGVAGLIALVSTSLAATPARAQQPERMRMGAGMMNMSHDSATRAQMVVIHELVVNHDRIKRTVTNLTNGIRAVTETDDPRLRQLIQQHVTDMDRRVKRGDDPGLPVETPAMHTIFRNHDKIRTTTKATAKGIVVEQTSSDSTVVAALQQHAAEVSNLVQGGMTALQERGKRAMGMDQSTSTHKFEALPDGGRIELQRSVDDTAGVAQIRRHLREIAKAFAAGDFSTPGFVHAQEVPGTTVMAANRAAITYVYGELSRGGEVRIVTTDPDALAAIHDFLSFQRKDHRVR
ncbi:MAG: hypothetical protein WD801_00840 [Gemmatimonadaceae bacterium]